MIRITRSLTRVAPFLAVCAALLAGHAARAQDTALFTTRVPPNVMLIIDTSGSMNNVVSHPLFRQDREYNPGLCPNGYVPGDAVCTEKYLKYPLCSLSYGQGGFDLGSDDAWSDVGDIRFETRDGHDVTISGTLPAGCVATRNVFNDPDVDTAGNRTRWPLGYLQWYFSQNPDWDPEGDGATILQEILSTTNGSTSSCLLAEPSPPPATFGKYRRARITAAQQILRDVICQTSQVADIRYGLARYATGNDPAGGYVKVGIADYTTTHRNTLITQIEALEGESWTPLAETLFNVYRYFQSRASNKQAFGKDGTTRFPAYNINTSGGTSGSAPGQPVTHDCQKQFVVLITDGEPTRDRFNNGSSSLLGVSYSTFDTNLIGHYNTTTGDADELPPNVFFAPVMDGNSCDGNGAATEETCDVGLYIDDVAKFMHENDFALDSAYPSVQTIDVYTVGFTTGGAANALLQRAAEVGGGDFFSSDNPDELTTAITNTINSIVTKSQAFTSAAVPASRTTSGDNFYSAFFLPALDTPFWVGHLKNFDFSGSGEVLTPAGNCAIGVDALAVPPCDPTGTLRTTAAAFWDAATAMPNPPTGRKLYVELGTTTWLSQPSALNTPTTAAEHTSMSPGLVTLFGLVTADNAVLPYSALSPKTTADMASALSRYVRGCTFSNGPACTARLDGAGSPEYLGDIFHSNPVVVGSPNQAINETSYQAFADTWRDRPRVVYAGANDGFMHGFQAGVWSTALNPDGHTRGSGQELMGFMPYTIRKTIKNYVKHVSGLRTAVSVDGSPIVADVWLNRASNGTGAVDPDATNADKVQQQWRTVLIHGLRDGGQTYHALDVTNPPTSASVATTTYPRYLWGFPVEDPINGENDGTAGETSWMGNTWSEPVITRVKVRMPGWNAVPPTSDPLGYERWVAIFGAGYHTTGDPNGSGFVLPTNASRAGRAIYMVDITTGEVLAKKHFDSTAAALSAQTTEKQAVTEFYYAFASAPSVFDIDFDGFADVIYIGDLGGNLWKWVVSKPGYDPINGNSVTGLPSGTVAADQPNWPFRRFFRGSASTEPPPEFSGSAYNSTIHYQSFFYPPTGVLRSGTLVLAWGSGERADPIGVAGDLTDGCVAGTGASGTGCTNNNHYYVVRDEDPLEAVPPDLNRWSANYAEADLADFDAASPITCAQATTTKKGFFITGRDSEKFVSNSTVFLGTIFTGSFVPNNPSGSVCDSKGTSYLYAFDIDCGVGEFPGAGNDQEDRRMAIGSGLPTRPRISVGDLNQGGGGGCPSPPCCINKVVVVTSDGGIYNGCKKQLPTSGVKVRSWRER